MEDMEMKVVFDISAGRLAIEGDGPELLKVLEAARELAPNVTQIQIVTSGAEQEPASPSHVQEPRELENGSKPEQAPSLGTLRQFVRSLTLGNSAERIAAIAYYVNKIEGKHSFAPKDVDGWFTMCGFQKPTQMSVALFDSKRKYGYTENIGRAMWRISIQGENLILAKVEESRG